MSSEREEALAEAISHNLRLEREVAELRRLVENEHSAQCDWIARIRTQNEEILQLKERNERLLNRNGWLKQLLKQKLGSGWAEDLGE